MLCGHKGDISFPGSRVFSSHRKSCFYFEEDKNPVQLPRKCCTGEDQTFIWFPALVETAKHAHCTHTCWHKPKIHPAAPGDGKEVLEEKPMKPICFLWSHLCVWRGRLRWQGCHPLLLRGQGSIPSTHMAALNCNCNSSFGKDKCRSNTKKAIKISYIPWLLVA